MLNIAFRPVRDIRTGLRVEFRAKNRTEFYALVDLIEVPPNLTRP